MSSHFSQMIIPIDRNGFFCTSRRTTTTTTTTPTLVTPERHPQTQTTHRRSIPGTSTSTSSSNDINTSDGNNSNSSSSNTTITPQRRTTVSSRSRKTVAKEANGSWVRAILETEPCIVTQKGLILALKHQAPIHVIRFMLTINPNIMNLPNTGPTPLQVAVQHNASLEVIQVLLEASPFGLCITNNDNPEDPLSYAKRYHRDRPGLIELLSRPLSYWVMESKTLQNHQQKHSRSSKNHHHHHHHRHHLQQKVKSKSQASLLSPPPPPPSSRRSRTNSNMSSSQSKKKVLSEMAAPNKNSQHQSPAVPPVHVMPNNNNIINNNNNKIDREEINNVKTICAQLFKSHKKMTRQMIACKDDLEAHSKLLATMGTKDEILEELLEQQRSQFFRNMIALDMKERAYQGRLDKMEKRHIRQLEKRLDGWTGSMRVWNESTREQLLELQSLVDSEAKVNDQFRNHMADWIEKYQQEQQENSHLCIPSYVYSTNLGEVDEKVPLCGVGVGVGGMYRGGVDTTEVDVDPILVADENTTPLDRVKKRPWRPLFKHWDRIQLVDDN